MTRDEISRLAAVCLLSYDNSSLSTDEVITAWSFTLSEVPYQAAERAVRAHILESPFFPKPADIYQRVLSQCDALPDGGEAWSLVQLRIKQTYPGHPAPDWTAPRPVRQAAEAMGGLYQLRMSENPMADRAHFLKIYDQYRVRAAREANVGWLLTYGAESLEPGFTPPLTALPRRAVGE